MGKIIDKLMLRPSTTISRSTSVSVEHHGVTILCDTANDYVQVKITKDNHEYASYDISTLYHRDEMVDLMRAFVAAYDKLPGC